MIENIREELNVRPTWEMVERRALFDPMLHAILAVVRHSNLTREEVLITAVLALSDNREASLKTEVDRLAKMTWTGDMFGHRQNP